MCWIMQLGYRGMSLPCHDEDSVHVLYHLRKCGETGVRNNLNPAAHLEFVAGSVVDGCWIRLRPEIVTAPNGKQRPTRPNREST